MSTPATRLSLEGLDGSNPLAFLAALGTLRAVHESGLPETRLAWHQLGGTWCPVLSLPAPAEEGEGPCDALVERLHNWLCTGDVQARHPFLALGKNLSVPPADFRRHVAAAAAAARASERRWADFVAAFGCEIVSHEKLDRIAYTELCFLFGSGHQHYLETIGKLVEAVTPDHLRHALFERWDYRDRTLGMRWDPADAREHAYRWKDPGKEEAASVWGANLLAAEGASLFPAVPTANRLATVGFARIGRRQRFTWPIWEGEIGLDTVRSLLLLEELRAETPDRVTLRERGVVEVYRAEKIKLGEGANFKWSFAPARAA